MDVLFSRKIASPTFALARLGYAEVDSLSVTLRRSDFSEASLKLRSDHALASSLTVSSTYVDVYDAGTRVFRGRISEPLTHGPDWVELVAYDEWWWLVTEFRETSARAVLSSDHLKAMVEADAGDYPPRINTTYMSFAAGGPTGAVVLEAGTAKSDDAKRIIEAFQYEAGFVPYYDGADEWGMSPIAFYPGGELAAAPPLTPVTDRAEVRFEYGEGTIGNLASYSRQTLLPRNSVVAFGPGEGEARETVAVTDAASVAEYGKVGTTATFEEAVDLDHDARTRLVPDPPKLYSVEVGPDAPMLWSDFYVGDYVRLRVRDGAVDDNVSVRVDAVKVVNEDGVARIDSIVLMTEDAIAQAAGGLSGVSPTVDVTLAEFLLLVPADGDRVRITDANGWVFQYDADEATANKWKFVSGDPLAASEDGTYLTGSSAPGYDFASDYGPKLTIPLAGAYLCSYSARQTGNPATTTRLGTCGADVAADATYTSSPFSTARATVGPNVTVGGTASHTFARDALYRIGYTCDPKGSSGTAEFDTSVVTATPQKVSQA